VGSLYGWVLPAQERTEARSTRRSGLRAEGGPAAVGPPLARSTEEKKITPGSLESQGSRAHSFGTRIGAVDCYAGEFLIDFLFLLQGFFEHSRALRIVQLLRPLP